MWRTAGHPQGCCCWEALTPFVSKLMLLEPKLLSWKWEHCPLHPHLHVRISQQQNTAAWASSETALSIPLQLSVPRTHTCCMRDLVSTGSGGVLYPESPDSSCRGPQLGLGHSIRFLCPLQRICAPGIVWPLPWSVFCWGHLSLSDMSIGVYTRILSGFKFAVLLFFKIFCQEVLNTCESQRCNWSVGWAGISPDICVGSQDPMRPGHGDTDGTVITWVTSTRGGNWIGFEKNPNLVDCCVQIPALSLTGCVTLGKSLSLSMPQFLQSTNEGW